MVTQAHSQKSNHGTMAQRHREAPCASVEASTAQTTAPRYIFKPDQPIDCHGRRSGCYLRKTDVNERDARWRSQSVPPLHRELRQSREAPQSFFLQTPHLVRYVQRLLRTSVTKKPVWFFVPTRRECSAAAKEASLRASHRVTSPRRSASTDCTATRIGFYLHIGLETVTRLSPPRSTRMQPPSLTSSVQTYDGSGRRGRNCSVVSPEIVVIVPNYAG
jgi:hypothetical protein